MSKYVIARADFGGNTRYVKKFNMTYDINEADRFDTIEDAKDALRHHILTRVDFNLSVGTLNKIMSHYNILEINGGINNMDLNLQEATMLALQEKLNENNENLTTQEKIQKIYDTINDTYNEISKGFYQLYTFRQLANKVAYDLLKLYRKDYLDFPVLYKRSGDKYKIAIAFEEADNEDDLSTLIWFAFDIIPMKDDASGEEGYVIRNGKINTGEIKNYRFIY